MTVRYLPAWHTPDKDMVIIIIITANVITLINIIIVSLCL